MTEESKMVPPGDLANADAATPKSAAQECADLMVKWDNFEPVWSVEMGGIGPGYEQAIQMTAFEMLAYLVDHPTDPETWKDGGWEKVRDNLDREVGPVVADLGLSGAQWGAAVNISTIYYRHGPTKALSMVDKDRHILVSKDDARHTGSRRLREATTSSAEQTDNSAPGMNPNQLATHP